MVDLLLQAGASVTAVENFSWTALRYAVYVTAGSHSVRTVQVLLAAGAAVDIADAEQDTPLCAAAARAACLPSPEQSDIFNCIMNHISKNPAAAAPSALVAAAIDAAHEAAEDAEANAGSAIRQLLLAAAQQDAGATAASVRRSHADLGPTAVLVTKVASPAMHTWPASLARLAWYAAAA